MKKELQITPLGKRIPSTKQNRLHIFGFFTLPFFPLYWISLASFLLAWLDAKMLSNAQEAVHPM